MSFYILGIDQSTQGTKALLFDDKGALVHRCDKAHRQIIDDAGHVEHDPEEIYLNTLAVVRDVVEGAGIDKNAIAGVGISNQRETSLVWDRDGKGVMNAIVWQDGRAAQLCEGLSGVADTVREISGIPLSPFFPAAKLAWILRHVEQAGARARAGELYMGTVDTYLVYRLTGGKVYRTDYSNASRSQLFSLEDLTWSPVLCDAFAIPLEHLAEVTDSDGDYGYTDFAGYLDHPVPIAAVMGDSHGALFGQGCLLSGMIKATYGTGSSCMMNVGQKLVRSTSGLVTSLAWKVGGRVQYVLEGNINYTGAVITWLQKDLSLIDTAGETEALARQANPADKTYLVPAFTGLGAPYWDNDARAMLCGMSRTTGKAEVVRAALESIAYQITDIVRAMAADAPLPIAQLRVDGGPTRNGYLMQFQSDMLRLPVAVSPTEELSGMGVAYAAGVHLGLYTINSLFSSVQRRLYTPTMDEHQAADKYSAWQQAVAKARS